MNSYIRQSAVAADQMHNFLKDKQAWENAIALYQGPDPLDHWWNYICWYENHVHGDPDNKFRETLERCLTLYEHSDYYKQDVRMVRLWLKYIEMQNNPLHFYQVLHQRGLGKQVACFYIGWAAYYESVNAFKEAEAVYNLAFQEKAQPYAELHHGHSKLIYNKTIHVQAQQQQQHQQHLQITQHSGYQQQQQHSVGLQSTNNNNATASGVNMGQGHENIHQQDMYRQQVSYHSIAQHSYHHQQQQQLQQQQSLHIAPTSTMSQHHAQSPVAPPQTHLYHNQPTVHNTYPPQTQQLQDANHHVHGLSHPHTPVNIHQRKEQTQEVNLLN